MRLRGTRALPYLAPMLAAVGLFVLWPLADLVRLALDGTAQTSGRQVFVGARTITHVLDDPTFRAALAHSALWLAAAAVVPAILALLLALALGRSALGGVVLGFALFPVLLPATAVGALALLLLSPTVGLFSWAGWSGLRAPLADPHLALPALWTIWMWSAVGAGTLLFSAGLRGIARAYHEIALLEGAGPLWRLAHIVFPGLRRTIAVVMLVNVGLASQVFDLVYTTTGGGPGDSTLLLPLDMYALAFGGQMSQGAVSALSQVVLALLVAMPCLLLLRGAERFGDGEGGDRPLGSRVPATLVAAIATLLVLLPFVPMLRAVVLPGRSLGLDGAGPSFEALRDNLRGAWESGMGSGVLHSLALAVAVAALTLLLAAPAGYAAAILVRSTAARGFLAAVLVICLFQPSSVLVVPLFRLLTSLGLLDSPLGIVLPEVARAVPFAVLAVWAGLAASSRDILEAAAIDGASAWQAMVRVALPLARPVLAVAAFWAFAVSWNEYLVPTVVSTDGAISTVPTVLGSFSGAYDTQYGVLAAGVLMTILPPLVLFGLVVRLAPRGAARLGALL